MISLTAQNTATGDEIVSEQAQGRGQGACAGCAGYAAKAIRGKLGEDLESIKKLDTPFGQATTPSLEAFRAYALGDKAHEKAMDIPEADGHYLRAIEVDPNFAMAYYAWGWCMSIPARWRRPAHIFARAYELSNNVS